MEELDWKNLKIWVTPMTQEKLQYCIDSGILPVFITRTLVNSPGFSGWNGTSVHLPKLAPSGILKKEWAYEGTLTQEEFEAKYILELNKVRFGEIFEKLELMRYVSGASAIAFMGFPDDKTDILAGYINSLGILEQEITEL